jgi:OmpA-OmpF porin, OOP family
MRQIKWILTLAVAAMTAATGVQAAEPSAGANWYLGAGAGQSRAKIGDTTISTALAGTGASVAAITRDETEFSYKLYAGYQYNRYLAFEGGYFNLGSYTFNATTTPAATLNGAVKNTVGSNFDVLGTLPLAERFSLFARAGIQSSKTRDLFSSTGLVLRAPTPSKNLVSYKAGLGAGFDFTKNVGVRAEWERYRVGDGYDGKMNVDLYSLNLLYKF